MKVQLPVEYGRKERGFVIAGHYNEGDNYYFRRESGMNDWLITYTLGGEGYFHTPSEQLNCGQYDLTLLKPGTPHQYGTVKDQSWHFVWAHFDDALIQAALLPDKPLFNLKMDNESARKRIYRAFMKILIDSREQNHFWNELCLNSLNEVLMLLARRSRHQMDSRVEETLYRMSIGMRESVTVEQLAKSVHLSPSRLSHLFKESTGYSIIDALNRMRIRQAALLLEHTDRSASAIALDVGFHNYNHFINQFHKWLGMSPTTYKKEKRP